jgi:BTG family
MAAHSTAAASSLAVTLAHAVAYLTRSLIASYPATIIIQLQLALEANLTAQYAPTWIPSEPLRGSGRRCLSLSPTIAPPRAIHNACLTAHVDWSEWIRLLGNVDFDFFVDPGCISVRFGHWDSGKAGRFFTVWSEEIAMENDAVPTLTITGPSSSSKTLAQQLLEADSQEENELFAMIAEEVRDPTWFTPILAQFPSVPSHPLIADISRPSPISRPSSRASSSSSSGSSFFSSPESIDSFSSFTSEESKSKMSRRERARRAKVFIDTSKTEVTNYDGGKTTVLTGGVMLGATKKTQASTPSSKTSDNKKYGHGHSFSSSSANWRTATRV